MSALLEVQGVTKRFGGLNALDDLSFEVSEGEIVSIIGPNGAGKSTVFNVITGLYRPDSGSVRFNGDSIVGLSPNRVTYLGIARTFQNVHLFPNMTVLENAMVGQHCRSKAGVFGSILRSPRVRDEEERVASARRHAWTSSERASPATGGTSRPSHSPTRTVVGLRWRGHSRPILA